MTQPILDALDVAATACAKVADAQPTFLSPSEIEEALRRAHALAAAVAELELRLVASGDCLAEATGARDIGQWVHAQLHETTTSARAAMRLAQALDDHPLLVLALREGRANVDQVRAIIAVVQQIPARLGEQVREDAERHLIAEAERWDAASLRKLGRYVLEVVCPSIAAEEEQRRLEKLDRDAAEKVRLTLTPQGDGTTRISGLLTDLCASRLATYLHAFTNPRGPRPHGAGWYDTSKNLYRQPVETHRLPYPRRCAEAFDQLLETWDPNRLPVHGGDATTVVVTIDWESLRDQLGAGQLLDPVSEDAGDRLSAGQIRRLACTAKILPAVLGGKSEVLDLGRSQRLFSAAQRRALLIRDVTCRAEECDIPGTWSEAHHWVPWQAGAGPTDLANGVLLCAHHHHRAHDPDFTAELLASGDVRFHRRP